MVSKITIFEPHFDDAQFGPSVMDSETASESTEPDVRTGDAEGSRGPSAGRTVFVLGAVAAGLLAGLAAVRRARRADPESVEIEERTADEIAAE
jgi:hypothetical protein